MKIYQFADPKRYQFARASRRGTWSNDKPSKRIRPLIIEWEPGSDTFGDFIWPGFNTDVVVVEKVGKTLVEIFDGFDLGPVEFFQDPKVKKPIKISKATKKRIWLPYNGPTLYDLWTTSWIHLDLDRSTVEKNEEGNYNLLNAEYWDNKWDSISGELLWFHVPRVEGMGIIIQSSNISDCDVFRIHELHGPIFCKEQVKIYIEEQGFTNVSFLEVGETT